MTEKIPVKQVEPGTQKLEVYGGESIQSGVTKSVALYSGQRKIYVKKIKGFFQQIRRVSLWMLMILYFSICWISINGQQLVHFDLPNRKFHLYGITFWPQDFILLALALIICAFGLFFITTLFGRVWCGYTCPQTSWTFIFMWIEEKVEGSRNQRMKLDRSNTSWEKIRKKSLKHFLWLLVAFGTGLTFVGYFYPIRELVADMVTFENLGGWTYFWIGFFTVTTYLNAGWVREKVCIYMCPYARFQSVMFDSDTLVVSYDKDRGEPRGSRKRKAKQESHGLGDCVDCNMCVQVCPTGIDIRDGLQYECIGCALCVDACDSIMKKMNYDPGLISYTTEMRLRGKGSHLLRPKSIAYAVVLLVMTISFASLIWTRIPLQVDVIKDRGGLFQMTGLGQIENSYEVKIMNMSDQDHRFKVTVSGIDGLKITTTTEVNILSGEIYSLPTSVEVDPRNMEASHHTIEFKVEALDDPNLVNYSESRFLGSPE